MVLAAGGFPQDVARRRALFPRVPTGREHWPLAPQSADGSGISLGESVGGHLRTDVASPAAWCPVSLVPYRIGKVGTFPHIMDRAKPGSIGVLSTGRRFVNEANGYHDYVTAMIAATPDGEPVQAWQIADARFVRRYPFGMAKPRPVPLFPYLRSGYLTRGRTLAELARVCGIDPAGLEQTVATFNANARRGIDPDFGRGETPFNRYGGDPTVGPNPSLAPIEKPPFYAVKVLPGSFGTFAGLATDERARVLDEAGPSHRRPVCRGHRPGERHGRALPGRWHQHRTGDDVRLHRRARPCRHTQRRRGHARIRREGRVSYPEGATALVTGGASGIGAACAQRLGAAGVRVVTADIADGADRHVDITDPHDVQALAEAVGPVGILVNSAGVIGPAGPLVDTDLDEWRATFAVNVEGTFLMCREFAPAMVAAGWGRIVNLASVAGKEGNPNLSAYSAAKAAVIGLTKSLGKELATTGVLVNAVAPGLVSTPMNAVTDPAVLARSQSLMPMGRFGRPEEIAELVAWLASEAVSFSTGAVYDASGGRATY